MKYKVISFDNLRDLVTAVNAWLEEGYVCVGGVQVESDVKTQKTYITYHQSIVKTEKNCEL